MKCIGTWMILAAAGIILAAASCKKEVKEPDLPTPPTKWERIAGTYKVYDTTGVYLYEMKLTPIYKENNIIDSLKFENFDGEFNFTTKQMYPDPDNMPMSISIGGHTAIKDSELKRWDLSGAIYEDFNIFNNATIPLRFQKNNIHYYLSDLTPYYSCDCKQIAVKQQ